MHHTTAVIALAAYFLILAGIVWHTRKSADHKQQGFIIGGRKVGFLGTAFSQLTSLSDGTGLTIGIMLAAAMGFGFWWGIFGAMVGYAILASQAGRIREMAGRRNYVTLSDFLRDRCGARTERLSAVMIAIMAFFALAGQIHISGVIFGKLMGVEAFWGILLVAGVVGAYLWIGGYMTIIRTDLLQGVIIVSLAALALIFGTYPDWSEIETQFVTFPPDMAWGLFLFHIPVLYAYFDTWQRLFSAKSPQTARRSTLAAIVLHAILWGGICMFGITAAQYGSGGRPDELAYSVLTSDQVWPVVGAALGVCLFALIMSSLDSRAYTVASTLTSNILRIDPDAQRETFMKIVRISVAVMFALIAGIAIFIEDIVRYMINIASTFALIAPVQFAAVYYAPRNTKLYDWMICGVLIGGCAVWGGMFAADMFQGFLMNVVPIAAVAALILLALAVDRFYPQGEIQPEVDLS